MSIWHLLIILVIVVMIFGPQRFEQLGPSLGRAIRGFKKGMDGADEKDAATSESKNDSEAKKG